MRKYSDRRTPATFTIQITSMVDMFVIILVFLLKSFSTSPVNITPTDDLRLPMSSAMVEPEEVVKLTISKEGVFVDEKRIFSFVEGEIGPDQTDGSDPLFIRDLFNELDEKAKLTKDIAEVNETVAFDGKIMVAADKEVPYAVLRKVLYTSMLAGYADVKFAVASKNF